MGPFYCPLDQKVYLDLSFFQELEQKFGAPGDFAQAYVIAHEVGHHVQNLTGTAEKVQQAQQRASSKAEANQYSVMLELQADCYAGVWARDAAPRLNITQQDIDEGMRAATAIGDDTLQRATQGRVVPDAFTHGTAEQRSRWLMTGMNSGDPERLRHVQLAAALALAAGGRIRARPPRWKGRHALAGSRMSCHAQRSRLQRLASSQVDLAAVPRQLEVAATGFLARRLVDEPDRAFPIQDAGRRT